MTNFWHNKSTYEIARDYLVDSLDSCVNCQIKDMDDLIRLTCQNITVKSNAKQFVGDYFPDALAAINHFKPDGYYRITDYDYTANMILRKAAREILPYCETAKKFDGEYHRYSKEDIETLKAELNGLKFNYNFQRSVDMKGETIEGFAYRYLYHVLPKTENLKVEIKQIPTVLPMCPDFTQEEAVAYIKRNFDDAMAMIDKFANSGYMVDYGDAPKMIQAIVFQKAKEILTENEMLNKLTDVDPFFDDPVTEVIMDKDFIDNLVDSLHKQEEGKVVHKYYEQPKDRTPTKNKNAKVYNPKVTVKCEYII